MGRELELVGTLNGHTQQVTWKTWTKALENLSQVSLEKGRRLSTKDGCSDQPVAVKFHPTLTLTGTRFSLSLMSSDGGLMIDAATLRCRGTRCQD